MRWFIENRKDLSRHISHCTQDGGKRLLAVPSLERLQRVLKFMLDENEFLSPHGLRSLSKVHAAKPFVIASTAASSNATTRPAKRTRKCSAEFKLARAGLVSGELSAHRSAGTLSPFLRRASHRRMSRRLWQSNESQQVADELSTRMTKLFSRDEDGNRPCCVEGEYLLFHEYFHGETGKGLGASHQTGWTALVTRMLESLAPSRQSKPPVATLV
jgi:hypothetical protein